MDESKPPRRMKGTTVRCVLWVGVWSVISLVLWPSALLLSGASAQERALKAAALDGHRQYGSRRLADWLIGISIQHKPGPQVCLPIAYGSIAWPMTKRAEHDQCTHQWSRESSILYV